MIKPGAERINTMPKYTFPTEEQIRDGVVDSRLIIFNDRERERIEAKTREIEEKYGFAILMRQGFPAALRLHILGTTNYTLDQVVDLSKIPHEELMGYVNSFFEQMDDTLPGRTKEDCAKDLARTHKAAFEKIKQYKFENLRADNIEYVEKYRNISAVLSSLYIEHSQNMTDLRQASMHSSPGFESVRQAYNSVYPIEDASVDENKLNAVVTNFCNPVKNLIANYNAGNYKVAALNLELFRENIKTINGKEIRNYSLNTIPSSRYIPSAFVTYQTNSTNNEFEDYLYGISGTFDGKENLKTVLANQDDTHVAEDNAAAEKLVQDFLPSSIDCYASYFPEELPEDLLTLSEEQISAIEKGFHASFGQVYRGSSFVAGENAGLTAFDLISVEGRTIREITGDRYANYTHEQQMLALKLETMRQALFNQEGVKLKFAEWKKNPDNIWTSGLSEKTYEYKPLAKHLDIRIYARNGEIDTAKARKYISSPGKYMKEQPFLTQKGLIQSSISQYFLHQKDLFAAHNMDMYDCICIGNQTVNEIIARNYPNLLIEVDEKNRHEACAMLLLSEGFNINRPIYVTNIKEKPNGSLERTVVPVIFSGDGIVSVRNMQKEGMEDSIRGKANASLRERIERYANRDGLMEKEFENALRTVKGLTRNTFHNELASRNDRIKRRIVFFQPASRKIYDEIKTYMDNIEAEVMDACVRMDAYKNAAKATGNDEFRRHFEEEAEKIRTSAPFKDYCDFLTSLELSFGIQKKGDLPIDEVNRIQSFMEERTGHTVRFWPARAEYTKTKLDYAPLTLKVGKAADRDFNNKLIREYLDDVYINCNLKLRNNITDNVYKPIGQFILIGGQTADELLSPVFRPLGQNPDNQENHNRYLEEITSLIGKAIKDGKPVDLYITRNREIQLSTVPIRIESTDKVRLSEEQANNYASLQSAGHTAMLSRYEHIEDTKQDYQEQEDRLNSNADERFRELCLDEPQGNSSFLNSAVFSALYDRYIKERPIVDSRRYPDPYHGAIRPGRETPICYVIYRLIEESENRVKNGLEGYTIDQITSVNALSEEKQKYADEFKRLCEKNDVKTYCTNLLSASKSTIEYLDRLFPPEFFADSDSNMDDAFLGKAGILYKNLYDNYQELYQANIKTILGHKLMDENEFRKLMDKLGDYGKTAGAFYYDNIKNIQKAVINHEDYQESLSYAIKHEWVKNVLQANASLGRSIASCGERIAVMNINDDLFEAPAILGIIDLSDKDFYDKLNNGTILDNVFIDLDRYYRIKQGMEEGDIHSCVTFVNNKEEKEALRRTSLEKTVDSMEKELLTDNLERTAAERENLFAKGSEKNGLFEKTVYKNLNELTPEELRSAAELYDRVFGKVMQREGVRSYLAANPEKTEFDLFKVGNRTLHELMTDIPAAPALNVPNPFPVVLTENEILMRKAEVMLASVNGEIPLQRELVRRNAENNFVISGRENIIGITNLERIKSEIPELQDLDAFKRSVRRNTNNTAYFTNEDWNQMYEAGLKEAAGVVFVKENSMFSDEFKKNVKDSDPQSLNFEIIKTLYGVVPKYVHEWGSGQNPVYNRIEFAGKMQPVDPGNLSEEEFATVAYLASMSPEDLDAEANLVPNDSFIQNPPNHIGGDALDYINRARKNTELAVSQHANGDEALLQRILSNAIKRSLDRIRGMESVSDPKGLFANSAYMLKKASDLLNKEGMEQLKESVMNSLSEDEKKDLKVVLSLKDLLDKKSAAEISYEKYRSGEVFSEEQLKEVLFDIVNYNDLAGKWFREHQIIPNPGIPNDIKLYLLEDEDADFNEARNYDLADDLGKMFDAFHSMREQVNSYQEANRIREMEEGGGGRFAVTSGELKDKQARMTNADFCFNQAKGILLPHLTDQIISRAAGAFQNRHAGISSFRNFDMDRFRNMNPGFAPANELNDFLECLFLELSKDLGKVQAIGRGIEEISLPSELIGGERQDTLVDHPRQNQIELLKQNISNRIAEIGANPMALENVGGAEAQIQQNLARLQEDIRILDDVNKKLTDVKADIKKYYGNISDTTRVSGAELQESKLSKGQLRDGAFENFTVSRSAYRNVSLEKNPDSLMIRLNPEKGVAWQELRNRPVKASEDTNGKIAQIIHVMEGFGMLAEGGIVPTEESGKVYGYRKLMDARTQLDEAVTAGNIDRIREANAEYNVQYDNVKFVQNMIKKMFPNLPSVPPNVDSNRNGNIPVEFMMDPNAESVMNSLYLLGNYCKKAGISIEEMLDNPIKETEKAVAGMVSRNGFNAKCSQFRNVAQAFNFYADYPLDGTPVTDIFGVNSSYFGAIRPLEGIVHLEGDRNLRNDLNRQLILTGELVESIGYEEQELTETIKKFNRENQYGEAANRRFREGIKSALLSGGKLEKKYLPMVEYDDFGAEKPDAVNYASELDAKGKYADLTRVFNENLEDAAENTIMAGILEETLFDYLTAHPEDMEKQEYKRFEKLALSAKEDLGIESDRAAQYLQFKENYRLRTADLSAALKTQEDTFNKDIVRIQKDLKAARKEQRNLNAANRDTVTVDAKVKRLENRLLNAIDKRLMKLNNDYALGKVTRTYLKARHEQLRTLKEDNANTAYLRVPEFAPASSADAQADAKIIKGNLLGGRYEGYIKDLASFKNWKMHEEFVYNDRGELQPRVEFENQLTPEQWQKEYEKEIIKRAVLPAGIISNAVIARNVQIRNTEFEKSVSAEDAILSQRRGNERNIQTLVLENVNVTITEKKQELKQRFQNGQAEGRFSAAVQEHVVPDGIHGLDENNGHLFTTTDPMNDIFYHDIAEIIALGIAENRGGKIPGGNLEIFVTQIASDIEFKKILMPLADKLSEEISAPAQNNQRPTYWADKLIQMLDDRTIVKAYTVQKNAVKAGNDMASDGINKIQEAVNRAEAARPAAAPVQVQQGADVQGGVQPQQGAPGPAHHPAGPHM